MITAATSQLNTLLDIYTKILPIQTFPYIPFIIAAFCQSFAWMSGPIFLGKYTLLPRMFILILFAIGEYLFMSPAMNAGVEIFNIKESKLVITYHIITLLVFIFVNILIFKKDFELKYVFSFLFAGLAIYMANMD